MFAVAAIFGTSMLVAAAMLDPKPIKIDGLISYWAIMAAIFPFGAWPLLLAEVAMPTARRSRLAAVVSVWLGGTTVAVSVIYWIYAVLSFNPSGSRVDFSHRFIVYAPKTGIAVGLFGLSMLVSCGLWGAIAPILRPQVALAGAAITGCVLFIIVYGCGWLLVLT
jgi:hypothetical protein